MVGIYSAFTLNSLCPCFNFGFFSILIALPNIISLNLFLSIFFIDTHCCCSVARLWLTLCDPMDCSTPGFPPCPSLSPGVCSNSCPLSQWCHPTISSSVVSFSSCPQSFPGSGSFPVSRLFASGGQSIGSSASVFPMNIESWFPLGLTGLISLLSKGLSRVFDTTLQKHQFFVTQLSLWSHSHNCTQLLEQP